MSPKIIDKAKRREEISLKALSVFAKNGFEATSISQLANAVGMSKGTLYEYFASKDDLIITSLSSWVEQMTVGAEQLILGISDPEEKLRTFVQASMAMLDEDPQAIQLMLSATQYLLKDDNVEKLQFLQEATDRFRADITNILLEGVSQHIFRPEIAKNANKIAINLLAYLDGIGMHYHLSSHLFNLHEQIDFYLEQLLRELKQGI